mmetsp:Transcript_22458/g.45080  ORF Transcript_22458/g.45080 Transcript_22458/m.45080 type:complete len:102 (-) Transcript_22458:530-835(-)
MSRERARGSRAIANDADDQDLTMIEDDDGGTIGHRLTTITRHPPTHSPYHHALRHTSPSPAVSSASVHRRKDRRHCKTIFEGIRTPTKTQKKKKKHAAKDI